MILNLKDLNEHIQYHHFKMDGLEAAISLISKNSYMSSIDLQDAYYAVSIHESHKVSQISLDGSAFSIYRPAQWFVFGTKNFHKNN